MSANTESVKRMADLLKSGATMLFEHCPQCNSPLFKIEEDIWCPYCNQKVVIAKEGKNADFAISTVLDKVAESIITKIEYATHQIQNEENLSKLEHWSNLLSLWLDILSKTNRIQNK